MGTTGNGVPTYVLGVGTAFPHMERKEPKKSKNSRNVKFVHVKLQEKKTEIGIVPT